MYILLYIYKYIYGHFFSNIKMLFISTYSHFSFSRTDKEATKLPYCFFK